MAATKEERNLWIQALGNEALKMTSLEDDNNKSVKVFYFFLN